MVIDVVWDEPYALMIPAAKLFDDILTYGSITEPSLPTHNNILFATKHRISRHPSILSMSCIYEFVAIQFAE